ncbi:MAG: O-antigen ligase family protein [Okeania sp. SIO2H7]|nr:O-antigen ligase family protein [Okeania sp. SIO2H7]
MSSQKAFTIILIFLVVGSVGAILLIENWVEFLSASDKDPTLTGRTEFWPQLIEAINKKPLLGYGYHNFWQPWRGIDNPAANIETPNGFKPPHAHNGFIEIGLDLGYVGLLLFTISFLRSLALGSILLTKSRPLESSLPIIFLSFLVLQNVTESRLFSINFTWFYYIMFSVKLNHQDNEFNP